MNDKTEAGNGNSGRREHPRVDCGDAKLNAIARFDDGQTQEFQIIARNVSKGGISFWREKPMAIGVACRLALPTNDGELIGVDGKVTFSKRLGMTVNEIGVEFMRPLDDEEFGMLSVADAGVARAAG